VNQRNKNKGRDYFSRQIRARHAKKPEKERGETKVTDEEKGNPLGKVKESEPANKASKLSANPRQGEFKGAEDTKEQGHQSREHRKSSNKERKDRNQKESLQVGGVGATWNAKRKKEKES